MSTLAFPPCGIERRLAEQYVNIYCRETGFPLSPIPPHDQTAAPLPPPYLAWREAGLTPFMLPLPQSGQQIAGALSYVSSIGYHRLGDVLWLGHLGKWARLDDVRQLCDLIAAGLAATSPAPELAHDNMERLRGLMRQSVARVKRFHQDTAPPPTRPAYAASEQGLRFGHVFHVTAKAAEGCNDGDLDEYAPELGAAFRLHYFAVRAGLLESCAIGRQALPVDPEAARHADALLDDGDYRLLPCHPWQARYLTGQPRIMEWLRDGSMLSLGPMGELAWPTSSVRTVWLPRQALFLKLPLNLRITNFMRNNPDLLVRRALDVSRALALLPAERIRSMRFQVLPEIGYDAPRVANGALRAACAVLYREAMPLEESSQVHLMATLLEESATGALPLLDILRQAGGGSIDTALAMRWWLRYLDVTLLPMLELYADYGVSLEAHLQNSLVRFIEGWPVCGYVRDMEGAAISSLRFPFAGTMDIDSPALCPEEHAWRQLQYAVLVNHVGHVAACLARAQLGDEANFWRAAVRRLRLCSPNARLLVDELLYQPTLPAKANMLSSFHQQGESPAWVCVPNPLKR